MNNKIFRIYIVICLQILISIVDVTFGYTKKSPTVFVAILVRNKGHALPYFLTLLTQISYPKNRISIWIRSDHNEDNSADILKKWTNVYHKHYHLLDIEIDNSSKRFDNEIEISIWSQSRYKLLIKLREEALQSARRVWADYIWFLDCDSFITNPATLSNLIKTEKLIVAPMLMSDTMYSNFWCGMTSSYYYIRTDEYPELLNRKKIGCFAVPMVHSATLIDLRAEISDLLTFDPENIKNYTGPIDDIIAFAIGANKSGIQLYICNDMMYGYTMVPLDENEDISDDKNHLMNLKMYVTVDEPQFPVNELFSEFLQYPSKSKFGFDEIFIINLKRRTERKIRMIYCLNELGINATFFEAVDGMNLKDDQLNEMNVKLMIDYEDPYHKRPMKKGEIGCFLSHYKIWQEIVKNNLKKVIVLEDDVRFEKFFIQKLKQMIIDLNNISVQWDLVYLGRKIMQPKKEFFVENMEHLVYPSYCYWTIGYILTIEGARKLIDAMPLQNLIPVDEFLPIMFDKHPRDDWKKYFPIRNLKALSVNPLIITPMKYTHELGYVSDTEDSNTVITINKNKKDEL